ncbi:anti-sigma regulatory factor (Ser/Thr protein kinase) [Kitasatospora sp. MAP12-15]|uniref:ATP-binding protein n=1 Tax=unclassified Kitasatospora TaxID=2633591 RepID=UPI002475C286|nr:ATP-binding protein [Kitasatospora sp. MAP12-44]MDH6107879.1 anti-sigma regulatory factor (Ser/Thr protein kinase) [Kitasatospora sp. MAP12-44]
MTTTTFGTGIAAGLTAQGPMLPAPRPGLYLANRLGGITAHLTADQETVSTVRALALTVLVAHGIDRESAEDAQLVLSELIGNAVRACGAHVPLVVEVYRAEHDAIVAVHDPLAGTGPRRTTAEPDGDEAESGRGLVLLDVLAPGWTVEPSAIGKRIRCRIPAAR